MSTNEMLLLVVVILAIIVLASFLVFRRRARVKMKGPGGVSLDLDASNEQPAPRPGVEAEDIKSRHGGLVAEDDAGRGVKVKGVDVDKDVQLTNKPPKEDSNPKA